MADLEKQLSDGMKAMDEGDFKKAYSKFKKLAEDFPKSAEAWFLRADTGRMASGMFGAKIADEEIMTSYKKAIELDAENCEYYAEYGAFCIEIGKYDEAEKAYNEAAELDSAESPRFFSEFATSYYNNVLAKYGEIMDDPKARAPYAKKALLYMLKALEMEPEEAKSLL
ncbi:MAG: hypothetical protein LBV13_04445 [Methanomassiliicoccaceae archaeon]|jgi:Tfp pilus assembly protein PilF|nr:hypothetical protein [Methanomassiliicoccaceae archaeon]